MTPSVSHDMIYRKANQEVDNMINKQQQQQHNNGCSNNDGNGNGNGNCNGSSTDSLLSLYNQHRALLTKSKKTSSFVSNFS